MTTPNEKASSVASTEGLDNLPNGADFATHGDMRKAVSTLMAKLALRGHAVHPLPCAGYVVSKHGYTYHAEDFADLQTFAEKLGV